MNSNYGDVSSQPQTALHLLFIVGLSLAYESLFVSNGFNPLDDSWPIYALWNLEAGGTLYRDVLWVFPPGHLIPAWIGYHLAPPGLFGARVIYGAFAVASCVGLYLLGRRLMPARFALFAAVLAAVAAPDSHLMHTIFGYRYLIFSMLALLAYARRIETDDVRWLAVAGLWLGVGAFFRLGPVFAAGCGLGVAVMSMHRDPRDWARDWAALALGILAIFVPLLLWAALTVGLDSIWREIVSRPALMDWRQSLPFPEIVFPDTWHRVHLRQWFVSLQFRAIWLLYGGYFMALVWSYVRAYRERRSFAQPLLVAVWLWGGVFFLRSLTRSDEPHLDSAIPPVLLLAVHGVYSVTRRIGTLLDWNSNGRAWVERGIVVSGVALWIFMHATDTWIPHARRGGNPIHATHGQIEVSDPNQAYLTNLIVRRLKLTPPNARILDLSVSPMYLVLADRRGYPAPDIIMPGIFLTPGEETAFFEGVQRNPPALVIWPKRPFDRDPTKSISVTSPRLAAWVQDNYEFWGRHKRRHYLMGPKGDSPPAGW